MCTTNDNIVFESFKHIIIYILMYFDVCMNEFSEWNQYVVPQK